jgi:cysteinyl-tRNA synthetase
MDRRTIFVIDYSRDGTDAQKFTRDQIDTLKAGGSNLVLSYLSIGEAEEARWYWRTLSHDFLGPANSEFPDNYVVQFWRSEWQDIILGEKDSSMSRILDAGFDGVYLDLVDAYQRFSGRPSAGQEMMEWVSKIATTVRKVRKDFFVVVQNATCLPEVAVSESFKVDAYWAAIDAVAVESTFFYGQKREDNDFKPQAEVLRCLETFRKHGKRVFAVEYVRDPEKMTKALDEMHNHKMVGIVTDRYLKGEFFGYTR